ncbi:MAG TPA: hypothetical protein VF792_07435 [Ktedonobacterales bacterium]
MLSQVDLSTGAMAGGSRYACGGDTACRAATYVTTCATTATTCADATPTGALLSWDNEGRLTA